MNRRILAWLLVLVLAAGMIAAPASAAAVNGQTENWSYAYVEGGISLTAYHGNAETVTVPAVLGTNKVVAIAKGCFSGNTKLTEVDISHGIRVIGEEAFFGCEALKKVHISGSVNEIGARAFSHTALSSAEIPGSVRILGEEAFMGCEGLFNVIIEEGVGDLFGVEVGGDFGSGSVTLIQGIEQIGARCFYGCANLTKMRIPETVTSIGDQAMGYTDKGRQNTYAITGCAGTEAERYAKANQIDFTEVEGADPYAGVCGEDVQWSFDAQTGTLTISGTGRMYDYASAAYIPWSAYGNAVKRAVVEEGVTSLGEYAFLGCAVEEVLLPSTLTVVGKEAFAACASLKELRFEYDAPAFAADAFRNTTLTAWYPYGNATWTVSVRQNYGGTITWKNGKTLPFEDVQPGEFYYDPVVWAVENGITNGTSETTFGPDDQCMRAHVVTFLWRAMGSPEPTRTDNPFVDVHPYDFYYKSVLWALEKGITAGMDATHFGPTDYCNRAQVVTFLYRTMGSPNVAASSNPFTDVEAGSFYEKPVLWAVENGITNGLSATTFGPEAICNRAQIVTFLYRTLHE